MATTTPTALRRLISELPPPEAANDNDRRTGRRGGETYHAAAQRLRAETGLRAPDRESPLAKALRDGRVDPREAADLSLVAEYVALQIEHATRRGAIPVPSAAANVAFIDTSTNPNELSGPEITVDARRSGRAMQDAAGDAWPAVQLAVIERATMQAIGLYYGAPVRRAGRDGLAWVLTGLRRIERGVLLLPERRFLAAIA